MKIVRVVGQQELQVQVKSSLNGFRTEGNKLVKYSNGRQRKHWKSSYRHRSRFYLKSNCENKKCTTIHNLTIHHKIALSSAKTEEELRILCEEENCKTLCDDCHKAVEYQIALERNGKRKKVKKKKIMKKPKIKKVMKKMTLIEFELRYNKPSLVLEKGLWGEYRII